MLEIIELIIKGDLKVINLLLKNNIDIRDVYGKTPLITACQYGHINIIRQLLLYGANINSQCNNENTSLIIASRYEKIEVVKYLLKNNANVNIQNKCGYTALMIASTSYSNLNEKIIKLLLDYGANIYVKNKYNSNVLQMTSIQNCYFSSYNNCNCGYIRNILENVHKKKLKEILLKYCQFPQNMLLVDLTNLILKFII